MKSIILISFVILIIISETTTKKQKIKNHEFKTIYKYELLKKADA